MQGRERSISKKAVSLLLIITVLMMLLPSTVFAYTGTHNYYLTLSQVGTDKQIKVDFWIDEPSLYTASNPIVISSYTPHLNGASKTISYPSYGWNTVYLSESYYGQYEVHISSGGGYSWQEERVDVIHPNTSERKTMTTTDEFNYNLKSNGTYFAIFSVSFAALNVSKAVSLLAGLFGIAVQSAEATLGTDPGIRAGETWQWDTTGGAYYSYHRVRIWNQYGTLIYDQTREAPIDRF